MGLAFTAQVCTMIVLASALVGALPLIKAQLLTWLFRDA